MKELSIEEKAKRYDEAKLRMSAAYNSNRCTIGFMNEIFPELRESEDEKIRKELLNHLKEASYGKTLVVSTLDYKRWADWLEKQGKNNIGISEATKQKLENNLNKALEKETPESLNKFLDEQKPTEEYNITGIGSKNAQGKLGEMIKNLKPVNEVLEQKPADKVERKGMNIVEEDMTPFQKKVFCIIDTTIEEEQGLKQVCDELLRLAHDEIMWNHTWSEEDEKILNLIIARLHSHPNVKAEEYGKDYHWLKSLKDRVQSQKTWKPSDEQLGIIAQSVAALKVFGYGELGDRLGDISEQLHKLREE